MGTQSLSKIFLNIENRSKEYRMLKRCRWCWLVINVTFQHEIWIWHKPKMWPNLIAFHLLKPPPKQEWVSTTHSTLLSEKLEKTKNGEVQTRNHVQDQTAMGAAQLDASYYKNST